MSSDATKKLRAVPLRVTSLGNKVFRYSSNPGYYVRFIIYDACYVYSGTDPIKIANYRGEQQ